MNPVERYLSEHFLLAGQFAERCGIDTDWLAGLIANGLVPGPTYRIDADGTMHSRAFGPIASPGAPAGDWFNAHGAVWVERALRALAGQGGDPERSTRSLRLDFHDRLRTAYAVEHETGGPIPGYSDLRQGFDDEAFEREFDGTWAHFLAGTFGLCVLRPDSESRIAAKEATQARLTRLTDNGQRADYPAEEAEAVRRLMDRYVETSMPFSPAEYSRSSRKRLVEDVLARLPPIATR